MADEDTAGVAEAFEAGGEVDLTSDGGVGETVLGAEVPHCGGAGVDADAYFQRVLDAGIEPFLLEISHFILHLDGHFDAAEGLVLFRGGFRGTEEDHDGVADKLVDGAAVLVSDLRHFREVFVEEKREFLCFHGIRSLGEAFDVRKEDGELAPFVFEGDVFFSLYYGVHELGREVALEFVAFHDGIELFPDLYFEVLVEIQEFPL